MRAILDLVSSDGPPVFPPMYAIYYDRKPKIGEPFCFRGGHTSIVKQIMKMRNKIVFKTLHSIYTLETLREVTDNGITFLS